MGDEAEIRERIIESQKVVTDTQLKRAELDGILHDEWRTIKKFKGFMKMRKDQRRENHSAELEQLVKEQATGFEELKKSEVAHHAELTQKIEGYKMKGQPFSIEGSIALTT